ncbi:TPA: DUF6572 domain-containing protein [Bacillus cereus]
MFICYTTTCKYIISNKYILLLQDKINTYLGFIESEEIYEKKFWCQDFTICETGLVNLDILIILLSKRCKISIEKENVFKWKHYQADIICTRTEIFIKNIIYLDYVFNESCILFFYGCYLPIRAYSP